MQSSGSKVLLGGIIGFLLLALAFGGGVAVGWFIPHEQNTATTASPSQLEDLFKPFWDAWQVVHENYVDQPVDDEAMMRGAISGMMDSLGDPHSSYMDPDQYSLLNATLQGNYEGIGVEVDTSTKPLTIVSPFPGSPGEKAGLKPGDKVVGVDGEDVSSMDGSLVIRKIKGPSGTKVTLTIAREGEAETFDVEVSRARIDLPNQESRMLEGNVAYIRLYSFSDNTAKDLRTNLRTLLKNNPVGLILDLRYNGGGFLQSAVDVASEFIDGKLVVVEEYGDGSREELTASRRGIAKEIPLVVLVNEGSASASEIVAGAIQDYGRGQLVGTTTFGKGSVQLPVELKNNEGVIRVTIARWLTPKGRQINEVGLEPDVTVEITQADVDAGLDPQLDKAVELLTTGR